MRVLQSFSDRRKRMLLIFLSNAAMTVLMEFVSGFVL